MFAPGVGTHLGNYRIEELLGRGGMGVVYRAEDLRLGRKVALKLLASHLTGDERFRARFLAESRLAASIDHAGIVPIYEAGEYEGHLYIAMRFVEGTDLARLLRCEQPLAPHRALELVGQLADALDAAHARGLVHRDAESGSTPSMGVRRRIRATTRLCLPHAAALRNLNDLWDSHASNQQPTGQ